MIPTDLTGKDKATATEFAKLAVLEWGSGAFFWAERVAYNRTTEREREAIDAAVKRQWERVRKFLRVDE